MDEADLDRLRAKYAGTAGGLIHTPRFRTVADRLFSDSDRRAWPFSGIGTLLGASSDPNCAQDGRLNELDVALIGVPMDLGVTNRAGARLGPRAVRSVERIGPFNRVLDTAPMTELIVADIGDVPMRSRFSLDQCHADIEAFYAKIATTRVIPMSVGGDHSITYSILKGLARRHGPVGMVHIDAHCDTAGIYEGAKFHHGGPFRLAVLDGVLDPRRTIQIGIRGGADYLWEFSYDSGMTVIHAEEVGVLGIDEVIRRCRAVIGRGPFYVSVDVDSLEPAFAPGTGTPEVGGLMPREVIAILRGLSGLQPIGGDVVEVAPQYDATTNTAQVAAQILFEILSLIAAGRKETQARQGCIEL